MTLRGRGRAVHSSAAISLGSRGVENQCLVEGAVAGTCVIRPRYVRSRNVVSAAGFACREPLRSRTLDAVCGESDEGHKTRRSRCCT
jgi:hypothetical protein